VPADASEDARARVAAVLTQPLPRDRKTLAADLQDNLHHLEAQHLRRQREQTLTRLKASSLSSEELQSLQARIAALNKEITRLDRLRRSR